MVRVIITFALLSGLFACQPSNIEKDDNLFANLDQQESAGKNVTPGYEIRLPDDHASHPEYAIEWWYLTANLKDAIGQDYALQWTLFRFAGPQTSSPWSDNQMYMAHAKVSTKQGHWFEERFARGGVGNAGVTSSPFSAFLDDWLWSASKATMFPSELEFSVQNKTKVNLALQQTGQFVLHGNQGFSQKLRDAQQASYYYSQPHIALNGEIIIDGISRTVSGIGWFDHEWTSQYLTDQAIGWDWFSMHLNNNQKLMLFRMRHAQQQDYWSGTYVDQHGAVTALNEQQIQASPRGPASEVEGRQLPLSWQIKIAEKGVNINVSADKLNQWNEGLFSYYEGAVNIDGSHQGKGFMELTGY